MKGIFHVECCCRTTSTSTQRSTSDWCYCGCGTDEFQTILDRVEDVPLVVHAIGGWFSTNYQYLTNYKGIFFFTKSTDEICFNRNVELVRANKIWIPQ
jgi:hypothetical protein